MPRGRLDPVLLKKVYDKPAFWNAVQLLADKMAESEAKYGQIEANYPIPHHAYREIAGRVDKYLKTGDKSWLLDAANYAIIEYMRPSLPKAYDSEEAND